MIGNGFPRLRLMLLRLVAGLWLVLERLTAGLGPAGLWVAGFFSLWLLQIPQVFGRAAEGTVAVIFAVGLGWLVARAARRLRLPKSGDVIRRIEIDSNLKHRPLSSLEDTLANPDGNTNTRALWSVWQSRLVPALRQLRMPRLHPVLTAMDPFALRALALIILLVSFVVAGPGWAERIRHGMMPVMPQFIENAENSIVIWVTPPDYTGQGQIVMKGIAGKDTPVTVIPEGSTLKAHISGFIGTPSLLFDDIAIPMKKLDRASYGLETMMQPASTLAIRQLLLTRTAWPVEVLRDAPPTIAQKGQPESQPRGSIKIPLSVQDDYSVESMNLHIRLAPGAAEVPPLGADFDLTRAVISPPQTAMDITPEFDLAWHPWAGMNALMDITVRDHKGQTATLTDIPLTLPERNFTHPVAVKLISMRKRLIWTPEAAARNIASEIENIMVDLRSYDGDPIVFLTLRSAASHLMYSNTADNVARVVEQLWDTALRIEDGNLTLAHRDFMDAQTALQEALKNPDATPEEIARKMDQMRQAMASYMQELFREMQRRHAENGGKTPMITPEMIVRNIDPDALANFLDQMQSEAMAGNREAAREMMSEMERFMNMLDPAAMNAEMPQDMQAAMEAMADLQEVIEKQQSLLDDTRRQAQDEAQPQSYSAPLEPNTDLMQQWGMGSMPPPPQQTRQGDAAPRRDVDTQAAGTEQDNLRQKLDGVMQQMQEKGAEVPEGLGKASGAMQNSTQALGANDPAASIPHQEDALKNLTEGQQQMARQVGQRMQQMMMFSFGMGQTDPLGRPMRDGNNGMPWSRSKVEIPDQAERRRVQEIMNELRKKSGELTRPTYELDYFRRLMRQF